MQINSTQPGKGEHGVYFLLAAEIGKVKIGKTSDLPSRLRSLATASPCPLRLIAWGSCADASAAHAHERAIHERFRRHRANLEWFHFDAEIAAFVAAMAPAV